MDLLGSVRAQDCDSSPLRFSYSCWSISPRAKPRYDFRLEDLRAWHLVEASCRRCRHKAAIAHELLLRGRPSYTRLSDLERALRCQRCGARGYASLAIRARPRD